MTWISAQRPLAVTWPHARTQLFLLLLSFCLPAAGCVRAGFTPGRSLDGGGPDVRFDHGADHGQDLPDPAVPQLSCKAPVVVGTSTSVHLGEPALRVDALELVAMSVAPSPSKAYSTKRSATDQSFGAWSLRGEYRGDPTFFLHESVERAIIADRPDGTRRLEICAVFEGCTKFPVQYASGGTVVTLDMDGPSVATTAKGLLMAHNIDSGDGGDIYLATPIDASNLAKGWTTTVVPALAQPGYKEDDPALSPDGLVLLFSGVTSSDQSSIWYSARATLTNAFSAPTLLSAVSSSGPYENDFAPSLARVEIKGKAVLELYFGSDRGGKREIYRAECSY